VAVKIVRQPTKIALLGAPTSAAATIAGQEGAPAALRAAGLVERLQSAGYEVNDLGDDPAHVYTPDDQSPRARNIRGVLGALEALRPRVEHAVKSSALPLILSGDCSVVLATIAGLRRYFRHVSLIYVDRDAGLHTPSTTTSGVVDGMVVSHVIGRGAAELVRFWSEPPLVREPDVALFGIDRVDPGEEEALQRSPLRRYFAADVRRIGPGAAAQEAVQGIHGSGYECVLHFDVDVIAEFQATNYPGTGGLRLEEIREALEVFAIQKHLAAIEVCGYNPAKDPDGNGARLILDLLLDILAKRIEALKAPAAGEAMAAAATGSTAAASGTTETSEPPGSPVPAAATAEAWPPESPDAEAAGSAKAKDGGSSAASGDTEDARS
jgi:arginase